MITRTGRWAVGLALVLLVAGLVLSYPFLWMLALALLITLLLAVAYVSFRYPLTARQFLEPSVVEAGESSSTKIVVGNPGRKTSVPMIVSNQINGRTVSMLLPAVPAGESHTDRLDLPTDRRGHFDVGPLTLERSDPFGLFRSATHRGSSLTLVVHPEIHPMSPLPTGHRREMEGSAADQPLEGGISFHSLRDYEYGDDLRLIHWRSVAKTGDLMVRKNIITTEPRLMVLLDTWAGSYPTEESFEDAVRVAASMVSAGIASRYPLMFRTTGGLVGNVEASGLGRAEVMTTLAGVSPDPDDPGLNGVVKFADSGEGVSLGAVTGTPEASRCLGISRARGRFDMVTVVQVGVAGLTPPLSFPGALTMSGETSADVASLWRSRFG